ncbi:protein DpdH [Shewanella xiamenensis]|nr:protein DpdH [Shewanella xiamenensis]MCT8862415.1 ATP-binding protein [Shewanella xiamenensis]MDH1316264.1 protein DpdH [Shewanella xiamenensis]
MSYWPSHQGVKECIRTEAEELSETTLLAVHEPMLLHRDGISANDIRQCNENDLLQEFIRSERPLPIIGSSGVGKSHLIRWLAAKLATTPESADWHIVRIPKNASLRQVLEKLLAGLEGDSFEEARSRINQIGEKKTPKELAEELLLEMGQLIVRTASEIKVRGKYLSAKTPIELTEEEKEEKKTLGLKSRHYGKSDDEDEPSLRWLLNDLEIKRQLFLKPNHCIYQFAERMLEGAKDNTLERNDYRIHGSDLDFGDSLDLTQTTKGVADYIRKVRLNTDTNVRTEVADILNEVLGRAMGVKFEQMFRYRGGSFQDLFKEIRKYLHQQGRTLVVLVEDMAAISAIENVLIDSLMEESTYDGEQELCPLRSAIAVTEGYAGYVRRQGTIKTRAQAEWRIEEANGDDKQQIERIINFCGRYLNAARHGKVQLANLYETTNAINWPPVWQNQDGTPDELQFFGEASQPRVPLFPLSRNAIEVLVRHHCVDEHQVLRFNPRLVLNRVILEVVRDGAKSALQGAFPHAEFASIRGSLTLQGEIAGLGLKNPGQAMSLATIWGNKPQTWEQLRKHLPASVVMAFGGDDFASYLSNDIPETGYVNPIIDKKTKPIKPIDKPAKPILLEEPYVAELSAWLQEGKTLSQQLSNQLRKALQKQLLLNLDKNLIAADFMPLVTVGARFMCSLHKANGDSEGMPLRFFDPKLLRDELARSDILRVSLGLLRWSDANEGTRLGYNYPNGEKDFYAISDFMSTWGPSQISKILGEKREKQLQQAMEEHLKLASKLALFSPNMTLEAKLNVLLLPATDLVNKNHIVYRKGLNSIRLKDSRTVDRLFIESAINEWESAKLNWLELINTQNRAIEGDLAKPSLRKAENSLSQALDRSFQLQIKNSLDDIANLQTAVSLFACCTTKPDFELLVDRWLEVMTQLKRADKYPSESDFPSYSSLRNRIKELRESGSWELIKAIRNVSQQQEPYLQWCALQSLPAVENDNFGKTMDLWTKVRQSIVFKLRRDNAMGDAATLNESREKARDVLRKIRSDLQTLSQRKHG